MKLNIKNLFVTLSTKTETFCIIRGHNKFFDNNYRDIDCFVSADEFYVIDRELTELGFLRKGFRPNAVFYEKYMNEEKCIIDLHICFSVHGIDWNLDFDTQKHCREILGVRILNEKATLEHAILISIFQNKGLDVNIGHLPNFSELSFIQPEKREYLKAVKFLRASKKLRKISFFIFLLKSSKQTLFAWCSAFFHENLDREAINDYGQLSIRKLLLNYDMSSVKYLFIKLTERRELRFAWCDRKSDKVMQFISQHSLRARILKNIAILFPWLIKFNLRLPLYGNSFVSSTKRELLCIFFGTPSKDRSLLFCYKKNENRYYIKSMPGKAKSIYSADHEYRSIRFFDKVQNTFKTPRVKLIQAALVSREVIRSKPLKDNVIKKHLISLTKDQFIKGKLVKLEDFLETLNVDYAKKNKHAYYLYKILLYNLRNKFFNEEVKVMTSWAHCDVTPWNIISTSKKLTLLDFEKFRHEGFPVGYDLVHYYLSSLIFSHKNNSTRIYHKTLSKLNKNWNLLGILDHKFLHLNLCLVLIEYLAVAASSEKTLSQYTSLYKVTDFVLTDEKIFKHGYQGRFTNEI